MRESRAKALRRQRWEKIGRIFGVKPSARKSGRGAKGSRVGHKTVGLTRTESGEAAVAPMTLSLPGGATVALAAIAPEDLEALAIARDESRRASRRAALFISIIVHVFIVIGLFLIVLPGRLDPPMMVVGVPEEMEEDPEEKRKQKEENVSRAPMPKAALSLPKLVTNVPSPVAAPDVNLLADDMLARATMPGTGIGLGRGKMNFGNGSQGMAIGGLMVRSRKLGVVLDSSPSMSPYLPALRAEIRKNFRGSVFREIKGCTLAATNGRDDTSIVTFYDPAAVMIGIKELIQKHKVDAIYWFCDLQDQQTEAALEELRGLLQGGSFPGRGRNPVRFYVRSVDLRPSKQLADIIDRSGGEVEVGRVGG